MKIKKSLIISIFSLISHPAFSGDEYKKGDLVCSPSDMVCGIVRKCHKLMCEVYSTHLITRSIPSRVKPEYVEFKQVKKSGMYKSDASFALLTEKVKGMMAGNTKNIKKYSKVCYFIKYSNSEGGETRCGRVGSCNESQCQVHETHMKYSSSSGFTVLELPVQFQRTKQVNKADIITNGDVVEDFILWGVIDAEFIKLLH